MLISLNDLILKYNMDIKGVIHVGAHYGEEISTYLDNNIKEIALFEPLEDNYNILIKNIPDFVDAFNVGLGSVPGEYDMFVSSNDKQSSSILKPKLHLTHHPDVSFPYSTKIQVNTLDSYIFDEYYNFINMDVQGYELEVLKGATDTLKHVDYVYCEVNRAEVYENNALVEEIDEFLLGYNMTRVETSWLGQIWGDALYIRGQK
jgi:FkbM family methyltransferase